MFEIQDLIGRYRIFIAGIELDMSKVSTGISIAVSASGEAGSLNFTIADPDLEITCTDQDLINIEWMRNIEATAPLTKFSSQAKLKVIGTKVGVTFKVTSDYIALMKKYGVDMPASVYKYEFVYRGSIFHYRDPVRVFVYDSNSLTWNYGFSGFITTLQKTESSTSAIKWAFTVRDTKWLLQIAEESTSMAVFTPEEIKDYLGTIQGVTDRYSAVKNDLAGLTLETAFTTLVYGEIGRGGVAVVNSGAAEVTEETKTEIARSSSGIFGNLGGSMYNITANLLSGQLQVTVVHWALPNGVFQFYIDKHAAGFFSTRNCTKVILTQPDQLMMWEEMVSPEVLADDLNSRMLEAIVYNQDTYSHVMANLFKVKNESDMLKIPIDRVITIIGENPELYPPDSGGLLMLIPKLSHNIMETMVTYQFDTSDQNTFSWTTKLSILKNVVDPFLFGFYALPSGDLVLELPLMNYDAKDFSKDIYEAGKQGFVDDITVTNKSDDLKDLFYGSKSLYRMPIKTELAFAPGVIVYVTEPLLQLIGVRSFDGINEGVKRMVVNGESLTYFLQFEAMKNLGDSQGFDVIMPLRPSVLPNRPFYIQALEKIGWIENVQHSGSKTRVSLDYIRSWGGRYDGQGNKLYDVIGDVVRNDYFPLDLKRLLKGEG